MGPERLHLQRCIEQPIPRSSAATPACTSHQRPEPEAQPLETTISLEAEVPEVLLDGMREFLKQHPQIDQMQLISTALASFLYQNGSQDRLVSQHYLDGLFKRA